MVRLLGDHQRHPVLARDPHRVPAAGFGDPLAERILPVEVQTAAAFADDAAIRLRVHFVGEKLIDVERQELDTVGIDAAQVGGDEAGSGDFGLVARDAGPLENGFAELRQVGYR